MPNRVPTRYFGWRETHIKLGIVVALDQTTREGKYTAELWMQQTGKSVDELWQYHGKVPVW